MPGFTSYDNLISMITVSGNVRDISFFKTGATAQGAGSWQSLWFAAGSPGAGPTTSPFNSGGTYVSFATGGVIDYNVSTAKRSLISFGAAATTACTLMVYDRLEALSFNIITTGIRSLVTQTLPRYASGIGVQAWIEVSTATTTTAPIMFISGYTNSDGVTGRIGTSLTFPATATVVGCMMPLPLQAGDVGIQASGALNMYVSTATSAGTGNLVFLRPLAYIPIAANSWNERDLVLQLAALPQIFDGATLGFAYLASAATATNFWGQLRTAYA